MRLLRLMAPAVTILLGDLVNAQSTTPNNSTSARASAASQNSNSSQAVITTTITSLALPTSSGASSQATILVLTLTLDSASLSPNSSTTVTNVNGSLANATIPWNQTDQYLPFHIVIDPAYGILGGLLIISGIPVAGLGGKNRWSSLAIVSAYSVMLFTLVLILRFGVEPNLQPPSPSPPSNTLRGLYLLACIVSSFFGAVIGVFLFTFAKYWVSAAGGFAVGWFLLATRHGGLVSSTLGRWILLGSLTVGPFVASLVPVMTPHVTLISTAWIGATAFVLGVDCFTRAGLKEFYMYNLGFRSLFPSLNGLKYPLTQTMEIELGILAAVFIIGAAIQFRLLNMLQKRLKQMQEEEEARIEAEEVSKAAERFKNVGAELNEWEEKYGNGSSAGPVRHAERSSIALPQLNEEGSRTSSRLSLLPEIERRGGNDVVALYSPPLLETGTTTTETERLSTIDSIKSPDLKPYSPAMTDPELESKVRLLAEVTKARKEVKGSLDKLRAFTPTPSLSLGDTPRSATHTPGGSDLASTHRLWSASSRLLDYPEKPQIASQGDWDAYVQERKVLSSPIISSPARPTSAGLVPAPSSRYSQYAESVDGGVRSLDRRQRTTSMLEPRVSDFGGRAPQKSTSTYPYSGMAVRKTASFKDRPSTFHDVRLDQPIILGSAARQQENPNSNRFSQQRTMTYEELAERHRKRISRLQEPVTAKMREQVNVAEAKARWERQQQLERSEQQRREQEKAAQREPRDEEKQEVLRSTEEWRQSVHGGLDGLSVDPVPGPKIKASVQGFAS